MNKNITCYIVFKCLIRGLCKKYPTLFFLGKTSDRLEKLITVVGGTFMCMRDFLRPGLVCLSLLGS
jgi:hypothetical protein